MSILNQEQLAQLLQRNWTTILDKTILLRQVLLDARKQNYPRSEQTLGLATPMKMTITKFEIRNNQDFELWIEFSIPAGQGVLIGSHIYALTLAGVLTLEQTFGHEFLESKPIPTA